MSRPPILILYAPGTNRDQEAAMAVAAAGGDPRIVSVNDLRTRSAAFTDYAAVLLPGGFSYGDALGAGRRLAIEVRAWFWEELREAARSGQPILGICNGFQTLVKSELLNTPALRSFTLAANAGGRFECRWVTLRVEPSCRSGWLESIRGFFIRCPVAHGEGRFTVNDPKVVSDLEANGQIAFRYMVSSSTGEAVDSTGEAADNAITADNTTTANGVYPANPNGSVDDIAGLCDQTGTIVGLMPHPEDHIVDWQRPSGPAGARGSVLFEALVKAAQ